MKEFKGTPGPWNTIQHYEDCLIVLNADGYEIVTAESVAILNDYTKRLGVQHWSDDEKGCLEISQDEQSANANLIAAAPELLEALQFTIHDVGHWLSTQKPELKGKIEAAINKALGEKQ